MLEFTVNTERSAGALPHFWEKCVGSCHAYTALREDWRRQIAKAHREMGFQYVRFHGLFDDDMSVVTANPLTGKLSCCFFNVDSIFDFLLRIGMKPFLELSFMPTALASGDRTCFHYSANVTMPKDLAQWDELIRRFTAHLVERYGLAEVRSWYFEVWNEPNLSYFFAGTQDDYFSLYAHTARSIKSVDGMLPVGGPATAINDWIPSFIGYCRKNRVSLDFISTHHYPTDEPLWGRDKSALNGKLNLEGQGKFNYERGILRKMTETARREAGGLPLYYTEWNSSSRLGEEVHDLPYTAAFAAKSVIDNIGLVDGYSYWTFTDIFEEMGQLPGEFHGGFGMQTVHGIPKPVYHTFVFLHELGTERIAIDAEKGTVGFLAARRESSVCLLGYNYDIPGRGMEKQQVKIRVKSSGFKRASAQLVDEDHGNVYRKWIEMGSPVYPDEKELEILYRASELLPQEIPVHTDENGSYVVLSLAPDAVILLRLDAES